MKHVWKRLVAVMCMAAMLLTGGMSVPEITARAEDSPGELTKVGWKDLGITEDSVIRYNADGWGTTDKSLSGKNVINSSFRGVIRYNQTGNNNIWFQYGADLGTLGTNGVRFTLAGEGDENFGKILIYDMVNGGSLLGIIDPTKAGLKETTFNGTQFELGIDLWQPSTDSDDLKLNVYINGTRYNENAYTISNGAVHMKDCIDLMVAGQTADSIEITLDKEASPEGLTSVTWKDFGIDEGEYGYTSGGFSKITTSTAVSLKNTSFRGEVLFTSTGTLNDSGLGTALVYGDNSDGWQLGLNFIPLSDGTLKLVNTSDGWKTYAVLDPAKAGLTSFVGETFELGIDSWADGDDLKFNIFINGVQYNTAAYTWIGGANSQFCYDYLTVGLLVKEQTDKIAVIYPPEASPAGLKKIGWKDFGITEDKTYYSVATDVEFISTTAVTQTGVSFRGKMKYNRADAGNMLMLAFGTSDGWDGLRVMQSADALEIFGVTPTGTIGTITKEKAEISSFSNQEFELGLDIWQSGSDLKINVFINGKQVTKSAMVWADAATQSSLKTGLAAYITGSSSIELIIDREASPEGLTRIGWEDFEIKTDENFTKTHADADANGFIPRAASGLTTLVGTSFRGVIAFNKADVTASDNLMLCYGDTGWNWCGIRVIPSATELKFQGIDTKNSTYPVLVSIAASEIEGLDSFLNQEFELGIDLWEDNGSVKMNVFINGIQATYAAAVWENAVTNALIGNFNNIVVGGANDSIRAELPAEASCNLEENADGYLLSGAYIRVNDSAASGNALTVVGDYHVVVSDGNGVTATNVGCYKPGDAHVDGTLDIRDVVAVKKAAAGQSTSSIARQKAADVNQDGACDDNDVVEIQKLILGVAKTTPNMVYAYSFRNDPSEMPIGGFAGPYDFTNLGEEHTVYGEKVNLITDDVYQKIADCGINFISGSAHVQGWESDATILRQLALSEKYGLDMFVSDATMLEGTAVSTQKDLAARIQKYSNFKSYKGMFLMDEPTLVGVYGNTGVTAGTDGDLSRVSAGNLSKLFNSYGNLTAYVNMLPLRHSMVQDSSLSDTEAYKQYLTAYCENYQPKFLSYDYYPFEWKTNVITNVGYTGTNKMNQYAYFKNLAIIRNVANEYQIPFWTHIGSGDGFDVNSGGDQYVGGEKNPSKGKFKWQINVELAFGAKGIQYFPLVQPSGYELGVNGSAYYERNGLINKKGETNVWYAYAKEMNQQIRNMDHVLMNSVNKGLMVTGGYASENMAAAKAYGMPLMDSFSLGGGNPTITGLSTDETGDKTYGAIAGCFDYQGKSAVYVVNYNVERAQNITLQWDSSRAYKILDGNGETDKASATSCTISLNAGEAALLVFE